MNLTAVTSNRGHDEWLIPEINHFELSDAYDPPDLSQEERDYFGPEILKENLAIAKWIVQMGKKRNEAVKLALEKYPETTDIMLCDSSYVPQIASLRKLIVNYTRLRDMGWEACLGGCSWGKIRRTIRTYLRTPTIWYDSWAVPEMKNAVFEHTTKYWNSSAVPWEGLFPTSSLICASIFPRSEWDKGARFKPPPDWHGCEINGLFESMKIPKFTDLNVVFWRHVKYPLIKCIRVSLGLGRLIGRKREFTIEAQREIQRYKKSEW